MSGKFVKFLFLATIVWFAFQYSSDPAMAGSSWGFHLDPGGLGFYYGHGNHHWGHWGAPYFHGWYEPYYRPHYGYHWDYYPSYSFHYDYYYPVPYYGGCFFY